MDTLTNLALTVLVFASWLAVFYCVLTLANYLNTLREGQKFKNQILKEELRRKAIS